MTPKPLQYNLWKSGKSKCDSFRPLITNLQSLKTATNVLVSDTTGHFRGLVDYASIVQLFWQHERDLVYIRPGVLMLWLIGECHNCMLGNIIYNCWQEPFWLFPCQTAQSFVMSANVMSNKTLGKSLWRMFLSCVPLYTYCLVFINFREAK